MMVPLGEIGKHKDIWHSREEMHSVSLKRVIPHIGISSIIHSVMSNSLGPHGKESMGLPRQEYWSGLPFPSPRGSSRSRH